LKENALKQSITRVCALLVLSLSVVSCASLRSIDKIEGIVDVDWELRSSDSSAAVSLSAVRPGERYQISVRYLQERKGGKSQWKSLGNTDGITVSVDDPAFDAVMPRLETPRDPFALFARDKAVVTVRFPRPIGRDVSKDLTLTLPSALPSFRGHDGSPGDDGESSGFRYDGSDGSAGTDGQNLDLEIARYRTKGTALERYGSLILVRDATTGRVWLLAGGGSLVAVDASGGSGGAGGKGADRSIPEDSEDTSVRGGSGGDGGSGGRGGFVHAVFPRDSAMAKSLMVSVAGGKGGKGGGGGDGDNKDDVDNLMDFLGVVIGVTNGRDGAEGSDGPAGRYVQDYRDITEMFSGLNSPHFDRSRLEP
jgi:hypothetical protein